MTTILITGANRGLGLEHARRFAQRGFDVIAACRRPDEATALTEQAARSEGRIRVVAYDATDLEAPKRLRADLGPTLAIDVLFNNAGVMGPPMSHQAFGAAATEAALQCWRVNALAPLAMCEAFADAVAASQRKLIVNQSSLMGSIADNSSGGAYAYRASKAALNAITKSLAIDLAQRGITVAALHPGWVRTDMGGSNAPLSIEDSVAGQQTVIDRLGPGQTGRFFNYDGRELAW